MRPDTKTYGADRHKRDSQPLFLAGKAGSDEKPELVENHRERKYKTGNDRNLALDKKRLQRRTVVELSLLYGLSQLFVQLISDVD